MKTIKLQNGLYLDEENKTINSKTYLTRTLRVDDGYCFYDSQEEVEIPTYCIISNLGISMSKLTYEELASRFIVILESEKIKPKEIIEQFEQDNDIK